MENKKVKGILFVGTGGGNDIFSTILAMGCLWRLGWRWDYAGIAGVLSPFHNHHVSKTFVDGIFQIKNYSTRAVNKYGFPGRIGFVDAVVADMILSEVPYEADGVYGISLEKGSTGVAESFCQLHERGYEYIVLVDAGGDILYRGPQDTHVLSPMFDAMILKGFTDSGVPGTLAEIGPGTDGELDPEALRDVLAKTNAESHPISSAEINYWSMLYNQWVAPIRTGRTVPTTLEAYTSPQDELVREYRARAHMGERRWYKDFEQRIDANLCKNFYFIDPQKISNPFAVECSDPKDWFIKTQFKNPTNNEASLEYMTYEGEIWQFLIPSPLFDSNERQEMITQGIWDIQEGGVCDGAWMTYGDWERLDSSYKEQLSFVKEKDFVAIRSR